MSKIDKYIFKELFIVFIIGTGAFTGALFIDKLLYLTEIIVSRGVSFTNVAKMMVYIAPAFLVLTIPMGVLVASVVTFSSFSANSEMIALKAGGFSFYQLLKPVLFLAILTYILTEFLMIYALHWGNQSFRELLFHIFRYQAKYEIKAKIFNNDFKNMLLYVNEKDENGPLMKGVFISETMENGENRIINAKEGAFSSDKKSFVMLLSLKDGQIHLTGKDNKIYHVLKFDQYNLEIKIPGPEDISGNLLKGNRELSISELKNKIAKLKKEGQSFNNELVEFYKKISLPFTCLIFGFIGAPLGMKWSRSGKSGSFAISLVVIVFYYIMLLSGESLGDAGKFHPFLAMWTPNFLIIILAAYLVYKTANELPFKFSQYIADSLSELFSFIKRLLFSDINFQKERL